VLARLLAALLGAYALASALGAATAVALPLWLGWPRSEATTLGALLGLLALPAVAMGCFACRRVWQAWAGSLLPALLLGAAVWPWRALGTAGGAA
jgi:hypothetical protein